MRIPCDLPNEHPDAVGFEWSDAFRSARIGEVLASGRRFTMSEMIELQTDYVSLPARSLVPVMRKMEWPSDGLSDLRHELFDWDFELRPESRQAAIYVAWERQVQRQMADLVIPAEARGAIGSVSMKKIIDWLAAPPGWFAPLGDGDPVAGRDEFVRRTFLAGLEDLARRFGSEALLPGSEALRYGDVRFKHVLLRHPLSGAVNEETRRLLEVGPAPRGGNGYTVGQTGFGDNQTSGASFRLIVEAGDWDAAVFANTPGQVGDPASPMYRNLFDGWARDGFFPLYYTRGRIEEVLAERVDLSPGTP